MGTTGTNEINGESLQESLKLVTTGLGCRWVLPSCDYITSHVTWKSHVVSMDALANK